MWVVFTRANSVLRRKCICVMYCYVGLAYTEAHLLSAANFRLFWTYAMPEFRQSELFSVSTTCRHLVMQHSVCLMPGLAVVCWSLCCSVLSYWSVKDRYFKFVDICFPLTSATSTTSSIVSSRKERLNCLKMSRSGSAIKRSDHVGPASGVTTTRHYKDKDTRHACDRQINPQPGRWTLSLE